MLAALEARSAIRRRQFSAEISTVDAEFALVSMQTDLLRFRSEPLTPGILQLAGELVDRQNLRALDSIQLATALIASRSLSLGDIFLFVSSDTRLLRAATAEGFDTWNPTTA